MPQEPAVLLIAARLFPVGIRSGIYQIIPALEPGKAGKLVALLWITGKGPTWWLYFELQDNDRWAQLKKHGPYIRQYEHSMLMFLLLRAILDAQNKGSNQDSFLAQDSSRFLLRLLSNEIVATDRNSSPHVRKLEELMSEIERHPELPWTVAGMAERTAISRGYLSALFKKQHGLAPMEAVIKQRMLRAIDLLVREKKKVQDTALTVGYQSVCSFTRLFVRHVGVSPSQYRKTYTGGG
jgi:AraC-like DNA-binding protein